MGSWLPIQRPRGLCTCSCPVHYFSCWFCGTSAKMFPGSILPSPVPSCVHPSSTPPPPWHHLCPDVPCHITLAMWPHTLSIFSPVLSPPVLYCPFCLNLVCPVTSHRSEGILHLACKQHLSSDVLLSCYISPVKPLLCDVPLGNELLVCSNFVIQKMPPLYEWPPWPLPSCLHLHTCVPSQPGSPVLDTPWFTVSTHMPTISDHLYPISYLGGGGIDTAHSACVRRYDWFETTSALGLGQHHPWLPLVLLNHNDLSPCLIVAQVLSQMSICPVLSLLSALPVFPSHPRCPYHIMQSDLTPCLYGTSAHMPLSCSVLFIPVLSCSVPSCPCLSESVCVHHLSPNVPLSLLYTISALVFEVPSHRVTFHIACTSQMPWSHPAHSPLHGEFRSMLYSDTVSQETVSDSMPNFVK